MDLINVRVICKHGEEEQFLCAMHTNLIPVKGAIVVCQNVVDEQLIVYTGMVSDVIYHYGITDTFVQVYLTGVSES
jgi:hypothetical protein